MQGSLVVIGVIIVSSFTASNTHQAQGPQAPQGAEFFPRGQIRSVFVNCVTGSDKLGDGSNASPFLSPMRARDFVRAIHPFATCPIEVVVFGDCYPRNAKGEIDFSLEVLQLQAGLDRCVCV